MKKFETEWEICTKSEAFEDILEDDRWGCDEYVSEQEAFDDFFIIAEKVFSWRKTERFSYKFVGYK